MVKISIVVPVYNVEEYLVQCIESMISQTLEEIEIILIDDGSVDNCGLICDSYAGRDTRIQVIHKRNEGLSAARNDGLKIASGKYILFVDSDDWIDTDYCQKLYENAEEENFCDVVICDAFYVTENKKKYHEYYSDEFFTDKLQTCRIIRAAILAAPNSKIQNKIIIKHPDSVPWNKLFKNEIIKKNNICFTKMRAEDTFFSLQYFKYVNTIKYCKFAGYNYRIRVNTISQGYDKLCIQKDEEFLKVIMAYIDGEEEDGLLKKSFSLKVIDTFFSELERYYLAAETYSVEKLERAMTRPLLSNEIKNLNYADFRRIKKKIFFFLVKHRQARGIVVMYKVYLLCKNRV